MSRTVIREFDVLVLDLSAKHGPGQHHDCEVVDVTRFLLDRSTASHVHRLASLFEAHPDGFADVVDLADEPAYKLGFKSYGPTTGVVRISGATGALVEGVIELGDRPSRRDFECDGAIQVETDDGQDDAYLLDENWPKHLDQYAAFRAIHAMVLARKGRNAARHIAAVGQINRPSLVGFMLQRTVDRLHDALLLKLAEIACAFLTTRK
jgi:hypothetical protein